MGNKYYVEVTTTYNREIVYELYEDDKLVETVFDPDGNGWRRIRDTGYVRAYTRAQVDNAKSEYEYYKNLVAEMANTHIIEKEVCSHGL